MDGIVCEADDSTLTAIELAAWNHDTEIVRNLLLAGANVNKTRGYQLGRFRGGALDNALSGHLTQRRVPLSLVRTLLECGARASLDAICEVVKWDHPAKAAYSLFPNNSSE